MSGDLSPYFAPVSDDDPCGPDLRWDPQVSGLDTVLAQVFSADEQGVVEGEVSLPAGLPGPRELAASIQSLLSRTKSIPLLAANARALWMAQGLAGLALGLEALLGVIERWPDPATGVHPRADEEGDLGERYAALARTLHDLPRYASRIGWGKTTDEAAMRSTAKRLRTLFASWETPPRPRARRRRCRQRRTCGARCVDWRAWKASLSESAAPADEDSVDREAAGDGSAVPAARTDDPWVLLDATLLAMERSNRHSPAVLMLRLIATWKDKDVTYIVKSMGEAGLGLEALVKALQAQLDAASR